MMIDLIPANWRPVLEDAVKDPAFVALEAFLAERKAAQELVYPPADQVFEALRLTPLDSVRAVIVGQDPYPGSGQANGLAFSVPPGIKPPPSLRNILRELERDLGYREPLNGSLVPWAEHGVLLLNEVLTVRAGAPGSHQGQGWEGFTDAVIRAVVAKEKPVAFLLWGRRAQCKERLIPDPPHVVVKATHPSPLSARRGFTGSSPFSEANRLLEDRDQPGIDWRLVR